MWTFPSCVKGCMYRQPRPIKYSLQPHPLLRVRCLRAPCVVHPRVSCARTHTHKRLRTQSTFDTPTPTHRSARTKTNCSYGSPSKYFTHKTQDVGLSYRRLKKNNAGLRHYTHIPGCCQRGTDTLNGNGSRVKEGQQRREVGVGGNKRWWLMEEEWSASDL